MSFARNRRTLHTRHCSFKVWNIYLYLLYPTHCNSDASIPKLYEIVNQTHTILDPSHLAFQLEYFDTEEALNQFYSDNPGSLWAGEFFYSKYHQINLFLRNHFCASSRIQVYWLYNQNEHIFSSNVIIIIRNALWNWRLRGGILLLLFNKTRSSFTCTFHSHSRFIHSLLIHSRSHFIHTFHSFKLTFPHSSFDRAHSS